jgi:hypothetical protein
MGKPPVLQSIGRRPAAILDIGQHLDGGGQARSGGHCGLLKTGMAEMNHITSRKSNPSVLSSCRCPTVIDECPESCKDRALRHIIASLPDNESAYCTGS